MRKKEKRLVISFEATTMALLMEKRCRQEKIPGRLIPLPPVISAGCGLAWLTEAYDEKVYEQFMREQDILFQSFHYVEI